MRDHAYSSTLRVSIAVLSILVAVVFLGGLRTRPEQSKHGAPEDSFLRAEWFRTQRAYPFNHIPAGARLRSLQQLSQKMDAEARTIGIGGQMAGVSWQLAGPEPTNTGYAYPTTSGRVTALAIDPSDSKIVYLGGAEGGIWKTMNGGATWTPLTDKQASLAIGSIAIAPSSHETIYVGTGEEDFSGDSYYGLGLLKSTNAGNSWTLMPGPFASARMDIGSLAVHPTNADVVLAGTNSGVYRTMNGGSSWTEVLSGTATGVLFNPSNGNTAYAAVEGSGVYVSSNGGATWSHDNGSGGGALPASNVGRIALAIAPSSSSTLFAGIANSSTGNLLGLYKTTNGGSTWTKQSSIVDYCTPQCWYDNVIAVDPVNPNVVFVGGSEDNGTLFQSLDGGSSWTNVSFGFNLVELHEDHHALAFSANGGILFVGNDGGVWSTLSPASAAVNWTNLNSSLAITQFYPGISIGANNPNLVYGGTQDNGIQQYTGSIAWNYSWCGDAGWTALDFVNPLNVYSSCVQYDIEKSTLGGLLGTWYPATSGIDTSDRSAFVPPLVMDPVTSETLYFGTYRIYQTTNGASSWQTISSDLTGGSGDIAAIAVAPTNNRVIYVGTSGGQVQMTSNAGSGATWTKVNSGLPSQSITQVAVSPTSSSTVYVTFSGFPSGSGHHIYESTNSGASWTDISKDLPNTPVNDLVVDPAYSDTLYAATDIGVFYTTNSGNSWTTLLNGLPNVVVLGLRIYRPTRTLWAATHGRSMWTISVSSIQ
jgi:photosystem II stability/assembly factor-like uncharacterized protein